MGYAKKYYKISDVSSLYPKTALTPAPLEKLRNFCSDNNISVEGGYNHGAWVVTFSKFGVPFTVTFDSYTDCMGMSLDIANTIIERLTGVYKDPRFKIWANAFYGMSSGGRPTGKTFENVVLKYSKEDVKSTMEMSQFYAEFNKACNNINFNQTLYKKIGIKEVIFNNPATIVFWEDGEKTVVKCQDGDTFDKEKGLAMAISKKIYGNKANFNNVFKKWITED